MNGRVALITGGSKGLGFAMGQAFADSGASVALLARDESQVAEAAATIHEASGAEVIGIPCDVSDAGQVEDAFKQVVDRFERVDILINNAGHAKAGAFESITDDEWQYDFDLKLMAAVRLSRLVFPGMIERRWGRIINMLNTMAKTPAAGSAPTSVTRAAGMALTKVLAGEGAPHNILVNGLNIGRIESDQWVRFHEASGANQSYQEFLDELGTRVPLGRYGEASECAALACLLCSDQCGYVTGTSINVDGNLSPAL